MIDTPTRGTTDIPPAYYRDDNPPPPPPDDPHWHEWSQHDASEPVPRWVVIGIPAVIVIAAALHAILLLVVLSGIH